VVYDRAGVFQKMGVYPEQIIDLLALMGDSSDNIPGVRGIGPKTALKLLEEYQSLNGIYEHIHEIGSVVAEKLKANEELARLSYRLATVRTDLALDVDLDTFQVQAPDVGALSKLLDELEFGSLKKEIATLGSFDMSLYEAPKKVYEKRYTTIRDQAEFDALIAAIRAKGEFSFDTETTSLDPFTGHIVGISLSYNQNHGFYIPLAHQNYEANLDRAYVVEQVWKMIDDPSLRKYAHNMKFDLMMLEQERERIHNPSRASSDEGSQMSLL